MKAGCRIAKGNPNQDKSAPKVFGLISFILLFPFLLSIYSVSILSLHLRMFERVYVRVFSPKVVT